MLSKSYTTYRRPHSGVLARRLGERRRFIQVVAGPPNTPPTDTPETLNLEFLSQVADAVAAAAQALAGQPSS